MPYYNLETRQRVADLVLGLRVDRAAAAHTIATTPYFNVVGEVMITGLVGKVTVDSGANACSWVATPTAGTATAMCAALDINPAVVGDLLGITGVLATAMTYGGTVVGIMQPLVVTTGTIDFIMAAASGTTSWSIFYVPVSDGAYITST
jgi:hypothetical protein